MIFKIQNVMHQVSADENKKKRICESEYSRVRIELPVVLFSEIKRTSVILKLICPFSNVVLFNLYMYISSSVLVTFYNH